MQKFSFTSIWLILWDTCLMKCRCLKFYTFKLWRWQRRPAPAARIKMMTQRQKLHFQSRVRQTCSWHQQTLDMATTRRTYSSILVPTSSEPQFVNIWKWVFDDPTTRPLKRSRITSTCAPCFFHTFFNPLACHDQEMDGCQGRDWEAVSGSKNTARRSSATDAGGARICSLVSHALPQTRDL